ncbi:MAG: hypothetical protein V4732_13885 [Pseudomonadota bacterium]
MIIYFSENPEAIIGEQTAKLFAQDDFDHTCAIQFNFHQYYLVEPSDIELIALVHLAKKNSCIEICAAIFLDNESLRLAIKSLGDELSALQSFAQKHQTPWLNLSTPLTLEPIKIPKPWGQEIWYTGIEARGQANIIAQGFATPLPWVLALMPEYLSAGLHKKITLLKTLDPLPAEVYGDLYFELHEKKQEVYIVTHIDEQAWKNNIGAIRLGFDKTLREQYQDDKQFKAAYLKATQEYETIRRTIDVLFDLERVKNGIALNVAIDCDTLTQWQKNLPLALIEQEQQARDYMNTFSALYPLAVGDVVKVPCYVPHALQHGVRTLEFQTPVYERKILSFAQRVLTQSHWDTEEALENALCDAPEAAALVMLFATENETIKVEEVVRFDDFCLVRVSLAALATYSLPAQDSYGLVMPIAGPCNILSAAFELNVVAETAIFIPHALMSNRHESLWLSAGDVAVQVLVATAISLGS